MVAVVIYYEDNYIRECFEACEVVKVTLNDVN